MGLFALLRRRPHERPAFHLYGAAVAAARDPVLFARLGVPDTLDGRFDLVGLHVALLIRRLRRDADPRGVALAQAVFDAFFADMDVTLRELGVGDLSVGRRVRQMWEAFHGRARAYESALDAGDRDSLALALARNVWRGEPPPGAGALLAGAAFAQGAALDGQGLESLLAGEAAFVPASALLAPAALETAAVETAAGGTGRPGEASPHAA
ncbi:ubiquinol-cytochrome C chaperone [Roseomonas sp. NAR14]|uniref:Ubiquinol-cytochrome C chaperone n=1 Tax=Roseomonas acroporae TaxID=2937791 RepID=A0A9X1YC56_9PROT|nr:ubiquinol-cytochrome C chaperone family protein [Roseomonas acroporae]MCK8783841.1 ubiquinol-cytochrome C chaperone [Roseomonas acroporae]